MLSVINPRGNRNMHSVKYFLVGEETIYQGQWIKLIILTRWSSESISEQHTKKNTNIPIHSPIREKATFMNHLHMSLKKKQQ